MKVYKLSDDVISQIAKLVQVAILSGTDIVDHLRTARLTVNGELLELDDDYKDRFENNLAHMLEELQEAGVFDDAEDG